MAAAPPAPKGLIADLQQKEVKAQEAVVSSNEEAELRTKVDNSLNTKGFSGIQKWKAALAKVEEEHLDVDHEKLKLAAGPGAKEVISIMETIELSLCLEPQKVQSEPNGGKTKWDGMLPLAIGFLWSRAFDSDGMKEMVGEKDGIRIILEVLHAYDYEPEIVQNSVGCLASLCLNIRNREQFIKVGGCKLLADSFQTHKKDFAKYPQLPYNFCTLVKVISVSQKAQALFVESDTHEIMIKMMEGDQITDYVMEESCSALANIIANVENVASVAIKSKGLLRVIGLINRKKTVAPSKVIAKLVKVIWNMTDDPTCHDACFSAKLFLVVKELLDLFHDDNEINSNVFGVLRNLSHIQDLPKRVINDRAVALSSVIPPVVDALEHSHITGVQVKAIGFL